ncbi:tautomerase family protein [Rathayibacter toxicus]|uniref:4-oxalocrotonate tautomerase n=1 Tax=Rathayibacter toxicus TaxID=145458 RepID=A0A2S5Y9Q9_9MICO|nr:tautomerase family protein [Rathayibacter toxicus]PPG24715.1 4-oxalocrotonate tautomerase [Rathayibacter toxicus]PPG48169.1 4-oxalocrotonate tautomerase [Rathayibacter toxicus]PPH25470.1 4-oxalocrotonate tautomerase [Rathayibacter toxicus]PPH59173.1 4-oxalocrotonate tautomerase [Rathayibacter toxicus]PPH61282.1 4-oxalocrotonate tautomerase [Rathayibacter toxicus]
MPIITITQTPGKDRPVKEEILKQVTDAYVAASGATPSSVWVTITEVDGESWSIGGETLAQRAASR